MVLSFVVGLSELVSTSVGFCSCCLDTSVRLLLQALPTFDHADLASLSLCDLLCSYFPGNDNDWK
jgi:hypothetical protein